MSRPEYVTFTREALHALVWSKPLTAIAAEFGMSSNAFAKHCKKADVPIPWRGYWQRLEHGHKTKATPLPKATKDTLGEISIEKHAPAPVHAQRVAPVVVVPERLVKPHAIVKKLEELLGHRHDDAMLTVPGSYESIIRIAPASRPRARRLLHALFDALEARGHMVSLETADGERTYSLDVGEPPVEMTLVERTARRPHVRTKEERARAEQYPSIWGRETYDYEPSGELTLGLKAPWGSRLRKTWSDGAKQRVEDLLGEFVVGLEDAMDAWRVEHAERERERLEEKARQKREEEAERRAEYFEALRAELDGMARRWTQAREIRSFLDAVEEAVPATDRGEAFRKWLIWAGAQVDALDPLTTPYMIGRDVEPNAEQIAELLDEIGNVDEDDAED